MKKSIVNVSSLYNRDKKRRNILIIVLSVVVIAAVTSMIIVYVKDNSKDSTPVIDTEAVVGQLDGKSKEEIQKELDRAIEKSNLVLSINTNIKMKDGNSKANVKIENVPNNNYAFKVVIILKNTNAEIYRSGYIDPNYHIQDTKFSKELTKGTYEAVAIFNTYTLKDYKYVGQQKVFVTIHVLN